MKNRFFGSDKYKGRKPTNPEERTGEKDERSERGGERGGYKKRDGDRRGAGGDKKRGEWNSDRPKRDGERSGGRKEWSSDKPKREWNSDRPRRDDRDSRGEGRKEWGSDKPKREWNSDRPRRDDRDRGEGRKEWGSSDKPKRDWNSDRPRRDDRGGDRRSSGGGRDGGARKEWGNRDRKRDDFRSNDRGSSEIKPILELEEGANEFPRENRGGGERREWNNDRPRRDRDSDRGDRDDRRGGGGGWRGGRDKGRRDFGNRDRSRNYGDRDSRDSGNDLRPVLDENKYLMYGKHPVLCALQNPKRKIAKIYCSKNSYDVIKEAIDAQAVHKPVIEVMEPSQIDKLFDRTKDAVVHNGVVAEVEILETPEIEAIAEDHKKIVVLDKITDPHNAGAIIRSCAAFGIGIVLTKEKDSSPENATIAKTSAGYIEKVTYARLSSIQNSIEYLKNQGFKIIGLSGASEQSISSFKAPERFVLVTGSEGKGLSPNIQALCDELVKIDISAEVDSLNASVATAIALYALK